MDASIETANDSKQNIEQQIREAFGQLEELNRKQTNIRNAADLEEIEREISAAADKLAALMTALTVGWMRNAVFSIGHSRILRDKARTLGRAPALGLKPRPAR